MINQRNLLDSQFILFLFFISVSLINIFSSVHFVPIMLVGVVFIVFNELVKKEHYYSLIWIILTFLVIENVQGFGTFNLLLIALFIYFFIKSSVKHIFLSYSLTRSLYIVMFYCITAFIYGVFNGFDIVSFFYIVVNIVIDIVVVGLFI